MPRRITDFSRRAAQCRKATRKWFRRLHAERKALGLTTRGTVRKLRQWPEMRGLSVRERRRRQAMALRVEKSASGLLTQKGTVRKNYLWPELNGMPPRRRELERMRRWYHKRATQRGRSTVASLLAGGNNSALALQLKGAR
jgi:hypothetical protein